MPEAEKRIAELRNLIREADRKYYVFDAPELTDAQYDKWRQTFRVTDCVSGIHGLSGGGEQLL